MSKSCRVGHDIIETGDSDSNRTIEDANGEVVLSYCRKCHRGEAELEEPCISLIWATPDGDNNIAYMARVSNPKATPDMDSARLVAYLLRNHHWSPFEMANMTIEVNTTRDITAQILRHKSAAFQEFSTRYADVEELETYKECRFEDLKNRQNSFEATKEQKDTVRWWDSVVNTTASNAEHDYKEARKRGIAKEVARSILPIGLMPSKLYINGTVRTWIHYCMERTKPGVQKEHREIALAAEKLLERHFPAVFAAIVIVRAEEALMRRRAAQMAKLERMLNIDRPVDADPSDMGDCLVDLLSRHFNKIDQTTLRNMATSVMGFLREEMEMV